MPTRPDPQANTLIQCIEYDWSVAVRCPACGHMVQWGAHELVKRFRDQLRRSVGEIAAKVADHCEGVRPKVYTVQGAGMELWSRDDHGRMEPWDFRDRRLREFLAEHDLPMELADERRAAFKAWHAENSR